MIELPRTTLPSFSKVCDAKDWFDPAIDRIIREVLRAEPFTNRRQWEFATIYLALHEAGALRPEARGLGLGVGTEKLIFALAERVAEIRATDLYEPDSRWTGVRTEDPKNLVMSRTPWPLDEGVAERITAERADMRSLQFADESFDFAWSTGSFEHIGGDADFVAHLNEVNRVLKPGGVYAFTTVLSYEAETSRIPNNYYFHPEHFVDLLHASDLEPEPTYDVSVTRHHLNRPMPETMRPYGLLGVERFLHPVVALRRGVVNVANAAFLRKGTGRAKTRPRVVGFEETQDWLQRQARGATIRFWSTWTPLAVEARPGGSAHTAWHHFGGGAVEIEAEASGRGAAALKLVARDRVTPAASATVAETRLSRGVGSLRFEADAEKTYAIVSDATGVEAAGRIRLRARKVRDASAPAPARRSA